MTAQSVVLQLHISADEYLKVYRGAGKIVYARDEHGRQVQFPAHILQPFVAHSGVHGRFRIYFSMHGKYQRIERLS